MSDWPNYIKSQQAAFKLGVIIGEQRAAVRKAFENAELVEAVRQQEWARRYPSKCRVERGDQVIVPEGWPTGADMETAVLKAVGGDEVLERVNAAYASFGLDRPPAQE